jgi:hypothetical protein
MALSALYLLAAYSIPSLLSSHAGALERLTVDDAGTGLRISMRTRSRAWAECILSQVPPIRQVLKK